MTPPFKYLFQILAYVNEKNPARARYASRTEPESRRTEIIEDFSGSSSQDIFASALLGIRAVLAKEDPRRAQAWAFRNLGPRSDQWSVENLAFTFGRSKWRIYKWLSRIDNLMLEEFRRRELLPAEDGAEGLTQ